MGSRGWNRCLALELLLLSLSLLAISIQGRLVHMTVVSGSNVSLNISESLPENYKQLTWFYTFDQKIVEWDSGKSKYFESKFKGRIRLDPQSGALYISKVQKEDNSTYIMRVLKKDGYEQEWKIKLQVLDPVPKPVIKIEKREDVDDNCYLKLSCVIPGESVNYTWYGELPKEIQNSVLETTFKPHKHSRCYTCQVSNSVSSKNGTFCFSPPCTMARSFGVEWIASWLVITVPIILGLLLI
ncbi:PREDICTED: CD48 antigen isoform X2 [Mandrillus leucophaeus]|uniref:CD48 antigen n=1 Tax=Mandrillus leucophaeus TaxID=9568 RepID=A0A2K5YY60_MANLE|nr:PREDICTED: CD48 antigen isoform X2 [Mandrillus leucophaeus]